MKSSLGIAAVGGMLALAGYLSGKTGTGIALAQTLSIHLYDKADVPDRVLHLATDEASWPFRAPRIRIDWKRPSTESRADRGTDMTSAAYQQPDMRGYIVVRLVRRAPASVFPGALGYALPFAHTGAHVLIFYDRVETLANSISEATYIVLGYAMAHEIGHVLLGSSDHASGGLMQARWTPAIWHLASLGLLAFTREEAEHMGAGLQRLQAQQLLRLQQPTFASSPLRRAPE